MAIRLSELNAQLAAQTAPIRREQEAALRAFGPALRNSAVLAAHSAFVRALMLTPRQLSEFASMARSFPGVR